MTLYFENESGETRDLPDTEFLKKVAEETLKLFNCPFEAEAGLLFVDSERIRELNNEFRGVDRVTDVLSFPLIDFNTPGDFSFLSEDDPEAFDPETGCLSLGDIIICPEKAFAQAEEYGHSVKREISFLIVHSMLHLLGFDHETRKEEEIMSDKQEEVLSLLGISR